MRELVEFRRHNNLTQEQLGLYLGMKKSFISKIENELILAVFVYYLPSDSAGSSGVSSALIAATTAAARAARSAASSTLAGLRV